ncbi:hypothetical protein HMPREF1602_03783 [Escherichia coli 907889]|nr:hypothetical protein HMPREF1602_03783 [Escherichia coli 907889]
MQAHLTHWRKLLSFQWLSLCFFCESDQKTIIFRFIFISPWRSIN